MVYYLKTKGFPLGTPQKRRKDVDEDAVKKPLGMGYVTLFLFVCTFASFFLLYEVKLLYSLGFQFELLARFLACGSCGFMSYWDI